MTENHPHNRQGAYYVSVRSGAKTIFALGPFAHHARALSLVTAVRLLVGRAGLDPWNEFGYGTCRLPIGTAHPIGAFNEIMHVGPDLRSPTRRFNTRLPPTTEQHLRRFATRCAECGTYGALRPFGMDRTLCRTCASGALDQFIANAHDPDSDPTPGELRQELRDQYT